MTTATKPESRSHKPFAIFNRTANPLIRSVLRSPAHGLFSRNLALITVTGRRSGRSFTIPVGYREKGDRVTIEVGWPERKRWWRNLRGEGAPVQLVLHGKRRAGHATARGDEQSGVTVEVRLEPAGAGEARS